MSIDGIIGIVATILFGIIGIPSFIIAIRKKKYPKRMEFYILDLVRIVSPLVPKYDSIRLLHNNKETRNVSFVRGMFLCEGEEDVELKSVGNRRGLRILLPNGYKWLEVHPQERTKGLKVKCTIDEKSPNIMHITAELFKRDEAFTFDAYVEGSDDTRLESSRITVDHRLANTADIYARKINMAQMRKWKMRLWFACLYWVMCAILTCAMTFEIYYDRPIRYVNKHQQDKVCSAVLISNDSIAISEGMNRVIPRKWERLSIDEFIQKYDIDTDFHEMTTWNIVLMIGVPALLNLFAIIALITLAVMYRRQMRVIKAYEKIQFKESTKDKSEKKLKICKNE